MWRAAVLLLLLAACGPALEVRLPDGGRLVSSLPSSFLGVPYARAPRFAASSLLPPLGIWNASFPGPVCPQPLAPALQMPPGIRVAEDCLNLNVFLPTANNSLPTGTPLPVYFYVHGGAFILGSGSELPYDGVQMAHQNNIIVVTFNYRLGMLGFLALPEMSDPQRGAFGLGDQRLALQWVHANIGAFGGDASRITIGGQSAGGSSVAYLLAAFPETWPLFSRAIMESGAPLAEVTTDEGAYASAQVWMSRLNCSSLECLYNVSVAEIVNATNPIAMRGQVILMPQGVDLKQRLSDRKVAPVPVLFGNTANELALLAYQMFNSTVPPLQYPSAVSAFLKALGGDGSFNWARAVPCVNADCRPTIASVGNSFFFFCPTTMVGAAASPDSYAYLWNHEPSWLHTPPEDGVVHAAEIDFVFNNMPASATAQERELAERACGVWGSFINGNAPWKPFLATSSRERFVFDLNSTDEMISAWNTRECIAIGKGIQ